MSNEHIVIASVAALGLAVACDNGNVVAQRISGGTSGKSGAAGAAGREGGTSGAGANGGSESSAGASGSSGSRNDAGENGEGGNDSHAGRAGDAAGDGPGEAGAGGNAGTENGGTGSGGTAGAANGGTAGEGGDGGTSGGGSAGTGGGGGVGGGEPPSPVCDDGNPCTMDLFGDEACINLWLTNGWPCDDGNYCTLGDTCMSGQCQSGALQTGVGSVLGSFDTYGAYSFTGAPIAVAQSADRFVFFDNPGVKTRVTVADVKDGTLQDVGKLDLTVRVPTLLAAGEGSLAAVIDGDRSIIIGGDPRALQFLSISEDGVPTERARFPLDGSAMTSLTARGNRFVLCSNFSFFTAPTGTVSWFDASDPDAPVLVATGTFGGGVACGSVALSADGNRLYVNTSGGVRFADLGAWSSGPIVFDAEPVIPFDAGVAIREGLLLARSGNDIRVLDEATHEELSLFSVPGANLSGLSANGVFVQGARAIDSGSEYFAALYDTGGSLIEEQSLGTMPYVSTLAAQRAAVSERYAFAPATGKLFELTDEGMSDVAAPYVGNLSYLYADNRGLHSRSQFAWRRIDVSDPAHPRVERGGPQAGPLGIQLDALLEPNRLLPDREPVSFSATLNYGPGIVEQSASRYPDVLRVAVVSASDVNGEARTEVSTPFELPGGNAALLSAGDFIYRAETISSPHAVRFRRWQIGDVRFGRNIPSLDLNLETATAPVELNFDVDPVARVAVVVADLTLFRIDLAAEPPVVETLALGASIGTGARLVGVRGNRVVYVGNGVAFLDLESHDEEFIGPDALPQSGSLENLLGFDGKVAYIGTTAGVLAVRSGRPPEDSPLFPTRYSPTSLAEVSGTLVAAAPGGLITFPPVCD